MAKSTKLGNRASGCFLIVFFGVFLGFGSVALLGPIMGMKASGNLWVLYGVGGLFSLVGAIGVFAGLRMLITGQGGSIAKKDAKFGLPSPSIVKPASNGLYELTSDSSHKANFWGLLIFSTFWNGITWAILLGMLSSMKGGWKIPPLLFMSIFVLVGLGMLGAAIYNLIGMIMTGKSNILISAPVLSPGQSASFTLNQAGSYTISKLKMDLVCEESATFRQGTSTRTKKEIVITIPICELSSLTARNGQALTQQSVKIPADAMPSFDASNNKINWFIQVNLDIPGRPDVNQKFRLRVLSPQSIAREASVRA